MEQYIAANSSNRTPDPNEIILNIIVIPSNIEYELIDTSDFEKVKWMKEIKMAAEQIRASLELLGKIRM